MVGYTGERGRRKAGVLEEDWNGYLGGGSGRLGGRGFGAEVSVIIRLTGITICVVG
jgi:hypothetical protein